MLLDLCSVCQDPLFLDDELGVLGGVSYFLVYFILVYQLSIYKSLLVLIELCPVKLELVELGLAKGHLKNLVS